MPVSVSTDQQVIRIRSWGAVTLQQVCNVRERIRQLYEEHSFCAVVIDAREVESLPGPEQLREFGEALVNHLPFTMCFAAVTGEQSRQKLELLTKVVVGRGGLAHLFSSMDAANGWIARACLLPLET
jgi:hypothetical protein